MKLLPRFFRISRFTPVLLLFCLSLMISFVTRIVLLLSFGKDIDASLGTIIGSFIIGWLYDSLVALLFIFPFILQITFTSDFIYTKKGRIATIIFFLLLFLLLIFTPFSPKDYNKDLYKGTLIYAGLRFAIFLFLNTRSINFRRSWRSGVLQVFFFITCFVLLFNGVSEWFFWEEFSSRYNFIAVDYLIYTNEVLGNIRESYPIVPLVIAIAIVATGIYFLVKNQIASSARKEMKFVKRIIISSMLIAPALLIAFLLPPGWQYFSKNNYANELAGNGIYDFVQAFKNKELGFYSYYKTLPDSVAFATIRNQMQTPNSEFISSNLFDLSRKITYPGEEKKMNVVLISVESFSASFMSAFGSTKNITPKLDSLALQGMLFTNLYSSGTRTVRGLEALSLSIPPLPGESIVKRPANENQFSLGSVLKSKGYNTRFIYGGYGYFDNMNYFFSNNGYTVTDRTALKENEIHYANIWGVADEDLFTLSLKTMDEDYKSGKPFFSQVMTVSNHRPFTYPDGRIDIPPATQSRDGAVKYTDYAIGRFIDEASKKPWFTNTIFVIVADHCASSAGKQALPVAGYHIPMIIYSPAMIKAQKVNSLTAQIDIAPTILGLLNVSYTSKFFGQDIFNTPPEKQRAFISTYQGLGYLQNNKLVVQSPVRKVKTYLTDSTGNAIETTVSDSLTNTAISYYQAAAWLIKNKQYGF